MSEMEGPRFGGRNPDWLTAHGDDLIPVRLIDLMSVAGRLATMANRRPDPPDVLLTRLGNLDLPRLLAYLPAEAREALR